MSDSGEQLGIVPVDVVAARELSILFSALIGSLWLGEGRLGPLLGAAVVVLAGVVCVAFAR